MCRLSNINDHEASPHDIKRRRKWSLVSKLKTVWCLCINGKRMDLVQKSFRCRTQTNFVFCKRTVNFFSTNMCLSAISHRRMSPFLRFYRSTSCSKSQELKECEKANLNILVFKTSEGISINYEYTPRITKTCYFICTRAFVYIFTSAA